MKVDFHFILRLCSEYTSEQACESSCHQVSHKKCYWKSPVLSSSSSSQGYATCTTDPKSCNDGVCDALEKYDETSCPQDCIDHGNIRIN